MTSADSRSISFPRMFDDGVPLVLFNAEPGGTQRDSLVIGTEFCTSPDCPCRDMTLIARKVEPIGGGRGRVVESSEICATFDVDTAELVACVGPQGIEQNQELVEVLRAMLSEEYVQLLRQRWRRVKEQAADEWRRQDWSAIDTDVMVPYLQVFPSAWDLSVDWEGERFWLIDYWCLKPGCRCEEFKVDVLRAGGQSVGLLNVKVDEWKVLGIDGDLLAKQPWNEFIRDSHSCRTLQERRHAMREVARQWPRLAVSDQSPSPAPSSSATTVGRNDPCPCGSGRKYKKCCGA